MRPRMTQDKAAIAKHHDAFVVGDGNYLLRAADVPSHVWIVNADGSGSRRLTRRPVESTLERTAGSAGIAVVVVARRKANRDHKTSQCSVWGFLPRVRRACRRRQRRGAAVDRSCENTRASPQFSPDGVHVAYWYPRDRRHQRENGDSSPRHPAETALTRPSD